MKFDKNSLLLYLVTDKSWLGTQTLAEQVEEAIKGGVGMVQFRDKNSDADAFLDEAIRIQSVCRKYSVPFIINDNVEIAGKINADGVHVGQNDMNASDAAKFMGHDKILGVSVQTIEQAILAEQSGADYLGVGAVFTTSSKSDADNVSLDTLKKICSSVNIPVVAIGGINIDNAEKLKDSGICRIAVINAILSAENIEATTLNLKKVCKNILSTDTEMIS